MKKIFRPISAGNATFVLAATSLLSYSMGLLRNRIIATNFGTTALTDAYNSSFLIPDFLFNLFIAGALSAAFLPIFSDYLTKDKKEAYKIANTVLNGGIVLITALAIIAFIIMKPLVLTIYKDADLETQKNIINLTRILLGSSIMFAISNTLGNILMSYKHFIAYSISPILYNLGIILGITLLHEKFGIYSAAIGVICGASMHLFIRLIDTLQLDYKYEFKIDLKHPGFKKIIKLMIPKSISLIAWPINLIIISGVGMSLVEGGFAAFNFARDIQSFAVSLFGIAFATAIFPYLSNSLANNDKKRFSTQVRNTIQRILFFTIPAMIGLIMLSKEVVSLLLGGGIFDQNSIKLTSGILLFFAISIPFESLVHILARSFYALKNTLTPMIINISAMAIIALNTIFLAPIYGINWFSISFTIAVIFQVTMLSILLSKHLNNFQTKLFFKSILKTLTSTLIMAIVLYISKKISISSSEILTTSIRVILGASSYLITAYLIKAEELASVKYILARFTKKQRA